VLAALLTCARRGGSCRRRGGGAGAAAVVGGRPSLIVPPLRAYWQGLRLDAHRDCDIDQSLLPVYGLQIT